MKSKKPTWKILMENSEKVRSYTFEIDPNKPVTKLDTSKLMIKKPNQNKRTDLTFNM